MLAVPLLPDYDAFRNEALSALGASRFSCKLSWAAGPPTIMMAALAARPLPDTFDEMRRAHAEDPGSVCVYMLDQLTTEELPPPSAPEQLEADLDRLGPRPGEGDVLRLPAHTLELKSASRSAASTSSASTSSSASSSSHCSTSASEIFVECVLEYDVGCVLCGCDAAPEAAYIIPVRALGDPTLAACLLDAQLDRSSIDIAQNGMRLCATHHREFDAFHWAVNPADMKVVAVAGAPQSILAFAGAALDFSSRPWPFLIPPKRIWAAYYTHIYEPRTRLSAAGAAGPGTRGGARAPTALAAAGGAGSAAPAGRREARLGDARGKGSY